jgi:hypothetical protein
MSNTRNLADLLDTSGDIKSAALDNVTPTTSASDLTSGTLAGARIADDTITTAKVADGQITAAKVAADVATQAEIDAKLNLTGGTLTGTLTMESTDAGSAAAPELILYRNSASPADADYLGQIQFKGENDNGGSEIYAKVTGKITDASNGTEDGLIETAIKGNGSFTIVSRQKSDELQLLNGVNLDVDGSVTATGYTGSGANLTSLPAAQLTGALPAISAANLTNVPAANITGTLPAISGANLTGIDAATVSTTAPSSPTQGDLWFDSSSGAKVMKVYNGNVWDQMSNKFTASGGTITTSGAYTYHTFTSSGTFTPDAAGSIDWLIVAGGAGGARAPNIDTGGGGAGGAIDGSGTVTAQAYSIVIGAGGAGFGSGDGGGYSGANTTFNSLTAIGGGLAGYYSGNSGGIPANGNYYSAAGGGSGGGASWNGYNNTTEGAGTSGQGHRGGGISPGDDYKGNGGGGKGAVGADCTSSTGGAGGIGINWKSLGTYYAGGGGGAPSGAGGNGGGGTATSGIATGGSGTANTGGGGAGYKGSGYNTFPSYPSGSGGSGIVIIRYAT